MKRLIAVIVLIAFGLTGYCIFANSKLIKNEYEDSFGHFPGIPSPGHFDFALAEEKGLALNGTLTKEYYDLQLAYVNMIWEWLDEKTGIYQIDQELRQQEKQTLAARDDNFASWYRKNWNGGSEYFFLRTTPFVERLSMNELDELRILVVKDEKAVDFINRTLLKCIRIDENFEDNAHFIYESWGVSGPNAGLLLGIGVRDGLDEYWIRYTKELSEQMSRQTGITIEITTKLK